MLRENRFFSPGDVGGADSNEEAGKPVELSAGEYFRICLTHILDDMKDDMFVAFRDMNPNLLMTPEIREQLFKKFDESAENRTAGFRNYMNAVHSNVAEAEATKLVFIPNPVPKPEAE